MQLSPQNKHNNSIFILPFMTQTSPDEHTDTQWVGAPISPYPIFPIF